MAAMKIAILSRNSSLYSTSRLVEAGRQRGHTVRVLDPLRCYMRISRGVFEMHYKGRALTGFDAVIPRIGSSTRRTARMQCCGRATSCVPCNCSPAKAWICR